MDCYSLFKDYLFFNEKLNYNDEESKVAIANFIDTNLDLNKLMEQNLINNNPGECGDNNIEILKKCIFKLLVINCKELINKMSLYETTVANESLSDFKQKIDNIITNFKNLNINEIIRLEANRINNNLINKNKEIIDITI